MPRVSVIVPNYNHAQFLGRRLNSILAQSFEDFELIVLDDASEDNSLQVLQTFAGEKRMQLHVNQANTGNPFRQWNKGLELASGEYIWIAESDDFAEPNLLEVLVHALDANPSASLAYCQSWLVEPSGDYNTKVLHSAPYASFADGCRWSQDFVNSGANELQNYLVYKNTIPNASAVVFRRSQISEGGKAPEDMRLAGDWLFWARLLASSGLVYRAQPLNYFRAPHSASQRHKTRRQGLDLIEGLAVYAFIETTGLLTPTIRKQALDHHLKLWASLAFPARFSKATNRAIYQKILEVHPEARSTPGSSIVAPFLLYYLTAPLRRSPRIVAAYKSVRRGVRSALGGNRDD